MLTSAPSHLLPRPFPEHHAAMLALSPHLLHTLWAGRALTVDPGANWLSHSALGSAYTSEASPASESLLPTQHCLIQMAALDTQIASFEFYRPFHPSHT